MILAGGTCGGVSSTTVSITRGLYVVVCFLRILKSMEPLLYASSSENWNFPDIDLKISCVHLESVTAFLDARLSLE